jgi:uncharacterized membrane protein YoaK (UPF0700 family)
VSEWREWLHLTDKQPDRARQAVANQQLGWLLAGVAGAINAGGFFAVAQYTSHMTGLVSTIADHLILGSYVVCGLGVVGLLAFWIGAVCTTLLIHLARARHWQCEYALPLLLEAMWLLCFGLLGAKVNALLHDWMAVLSIAILCFLMGTQNALITKISAAEIRTTHVTGIVTDLGILAGRWLSYKFFPNMRLPNETMRQRLTLLLGLLLCFFIGGVLGALGFKFVGYGFTAVLACLLSMVSIVPVLNDLKAWRQHIT